MVKNELMAQRHGWREKDSLNDGAVASLTSPLHLAARGTLSSTTTLFMTAAIAVHPQCLSQVEQPV